ncbi:MAG: sulfite exporter TauE/SafE family protein [Gemmatimonadales bacterium]|nr:MAG: sulfite exporter TauE/SafE family protein [Gemmatimonadales bacterium]
MAEGRTLRPLPARVRNRPAGLGGTRPVHETRTGGSAASGGAPVVARSGFSAGASRGAGIPGCDTGGGSGPGPLSLLAIGLALAVGAAAGGLSGLLGIGGGIVLVPFLYLLMANPQWSGVLVDPGQHATFAHATSLAVIAPTALSGLLAFRRHGLVDWNVVVPLGMAAAVAAAAGAQFAVHVPSDLLKVLFGALLLWVGGRMTTGTGRVRAGETEAGGERPPGSAALRPGAALLGGGVVGMLSALLGVGGGLVAVPILHRWARMDLHRITAASIGIVGFAAPAGVLSYAWAGQGVEGLPPGSMGFVSIPLALALIPGAVLLAPLGARLNRRLPVKTLRRLFGAFLLAMGLRLVWLYLPALAGG